MNRKKNSLLFLCLLASLPVWSQEERAITLRDRIFFGGNFSLSIGSVSLIEVSPLVGYRITPRLSAGLGLTYIYFGNKLVAIPFHTNIYGGKVFVSHTLINDLHEIIPFMGHTAVMAYAENEFLSLEKQFFTTTSVEGRMFASNLWVGGGLRQNFNSRSGIYLMILWNLSDGRYSPYASPLIRAGFVF